MTGPHLTPEREAEIRADLKFWMRDAEAKSWAEVMNPPPPKTYLAHAEFLRDALDAERADHAQTRAALASLTTVTIEVLGSVRAVYGDTNQLVRDLDAQLQEAQRALGLVRPAPETT